MGRRTKVLALDQKVYLERQLSFKKFDLAQLANGFVSPACGTRHSVTVRSRTTKQASCSSTDHGGGKRRPFIAPGSRAKRGELLWLDQHQQRGTNCRFKRIKLGAPFSVIAAIKQPDGSFDVSRINAGRDPAAVNAVPRDQASSVSVRCRSTAGRRAAPAAAKWSGKGGVPAAAYRKSPEKIRERFPAVKTTGRRPACEKRQGERFAALDTRCEHSPNKVHGFSTDLVVVFAFRSVLNSAEEVLESS
jgi:hypothetical protein